MNSSATNTVLESQVLLQCPGQNLLPKEIQRQNSICANNIEFVFTIAWEASASSGQKTTLKFSSSFSLNDHSGFKSRIVEINKQQQNYRILEKLGMEGNLHLKIIWQTQRQASKHGILICLPYISTLFTLCHNLLISLFLSLNLRMGFRFLTILSPGSTIISQIIVLQYTDNEFQQNK